MTSTTSAVLVTGSSSGIGEACALHLDRLGHRVFAGVRQEADGQRLQEQATGRLTPVLLDVTDSAQVEAAVKAIAGELGHAGLGGVVNNAGIARGGPIEHLPLDEWRLQLEVNVIGQVAVTQATLPLIRQGGGRIVFIGSMSGRIATPLTGPYSASKFAIEAVTDTLRQELHQWRVPVAVVEPGAITTSIWDKGRRTADEVESRLPAEAIQQYRRQIDGMRKAIERQERASIPPDAVARAVEHALHARRPKTRYVVGKDARVGAIMARLLPDRMRDAVMRRFVTI